MNLKFLIAPDVAPEYFNGWHLLDMLLQRRSKLGIHLTMTTSLKEQEMLMEKGRIDLAYASPSQAAELIRQQKYRPFGRPRQHFDEVVIASNINSHWRTVEDLKPGCRIAFTKNEDVRLIGLRLLESADLHADNVTWIPVERYENAARLVVRGDADIAFFLSDAFAAFPALTRLQLHPLVESAIHDIYHVLLIHPRRLDKLPALEAAFFGLGQQAGDDRILAGIGLPKGFEPMSEEDAEFMIDLMDTLRD